MYKSGRCFFNKLPNIIVGMGIALVSWVIGGHAHAGSCESWEVPEDNSLWVDHPIDRCLNSEGTGVYRLAYYTNASGTKYYYRDCNYSLGYTCAPGTNAVEYTISVPGCNLTIEYTECRPIGNTSPSNQWCDNDYYYENGSCIECPDPTVNFFSDNGASLGPASGQCGYGSENGTNTPISSCKIYASGCEYCDDSGCFELRNDCWYNFS